MKFIFLFAVLFVGPVASFGQQATPTPRLYSPETLANLLKIQNAALASDYAYKRTAHLTNNIGPRLSGSPQILQAEKYVADEMRKLGLEVRLQPVTVSRWVRGKETGELVEFPGMAPGTTQKIVLTALGGSVATAETGMTAEIVVVTSFEELASLGVDKVRGKIVLFNTKFDRKLAASGFGSQAYGQAVQFRGGGPAAAGAMGAVAVLVRSAGGSQNRLAHTGGTRYQTGIEPIPAAAVSSEDADLIAHLVEEGKTSIKLILTPVQLPDTTNHNVIADLKGSERPDEVVIISGHLDSWDLGTGALDDASGVAVAMQVPYLLKQLGITPKRTIRVIAYANEENGLAGGNGYLEAERANLAKQFAAIESDLGASHPVGMLFAGKPEVAGYLGPISKVLSSQGAALTQQQGGVGADIGPLTRQGVPSFAPWFNTQTYFNYHHTAADTLDKIDPKQMQELGSLMAVLAYGLADLEQPLPR
jgi:Zn-dependent M28 family amino/carboxypeptidase